MVGAPEVFSCSRVLTSYEDEGTEVREAGGLIRASRCHVVQVLRHRPGPGCEGDVTCAPLCDDLRSW